MQKCRTEGIRRNVAERFPPYRTAVPRPDLAAVQAKGPADLREWEEELEALAEDADGEGDPSFHWTTDGPKGPGRRN